MVIASVSSGCGGHVGIGENISVVWQRGSMTEFLIPHFLHAGMKGHRVFECTARHFGRRPFLGPKARQQASPGQARHERSPGKTNLPRQSPNLHLSHSKKCKCSVPSAQSSVASEH